MLYRTSAESPLEKLERECNDEFRLLAELGPADFAAEHLQELRERARHRLALFERRQRMAMLLGATAAGWTLLALPAGSFGHWWLALAAGLVATICLISFLLLIVAQKRRFDSRGKIEHTLCLIEDELRRRSEKQRKANH